MPTVNWELVRDLGDPVIWLDVRTFDEAWRGTCGYIGRGGAGSKHRSRYQRVGEFIRTYGKLWYPHLTLDAGRPEFSDGRHRVAWLRDNGADAVPVTTSPANSIAMQELFGTDMRVTAYL